LTKRDLVSVVLKLCGIVSLVKTLWSIPELISILSAAHQYKSQGQPAMVAYVAALVVWAGVGLLLLWSADSIAGLIAREDEALPTIDLARDSRQLLTLALKTLGVILVALALPQLTHDIAQAKLMAAWWSSLPNSTLEAFSKGMQGEQWSSLVRALTEIAIGVYLMAGTRSLVNLILPEPRSTGEAREQAT
jgi:hypothetical protein